MLGCDGCVATLNSACKNAWWIYFILNICTSYSIPPGSVARRDLTANKNCLQNLMAEFNVATQPSIISKTQVILVEIQAALFADTHTHVNKLSFYAALAFSFQ